MVEERGGGSSPHCHTELERHAKSLGGTNSGIIEPPAIDLAPRPEHMYLAKKIVNNSAECRGVDYIRKPSFVRKVLEIHTEDTENIVPRMLLPVRIRGFGLDS